MDDGSEWSLGLPVSNLVEFNLEHRQLGFKGQVQAIMIEIAPTRFEPSRQLEKTQSPTVLVADKSALHLINPLFLEIVSAKRDPPLTLRFVTAKRRERSARLLSGGTSGWSRKYHHCWALSRKERSNLPDSYPAVLIHSCMVSATRSLKEAV